MATDTPRTDAAEWQTEYNEPVVDSDDMRKLERELAELRATYDLDTQWLKAENAALADALRVRKDDYLTPCPDCGVWITDGDDHAETCRHFATERKVMEAASSF